MREDPAVTADDDTAGGSCRHSTAYSSRSTRIFGIAGALGLFVLGQAGLQSSVPQFGFGDALFGSVVLALITAIIWRAGISAGVFIGGDVLRVEQLTHSWIIPRRRVRRAVAASSGARGLVLVTADREIDVYGLSGSLLATWSGNTSVLRAAAAINDWAGTAGVGEAGTIERRAFRRVMRDIAVILAVWPISFILLHSVMGVGLVG